MFFRRVAQYAGRPRYRHRTGSGWREVSWSKMGERVRQAAAGLLQLGVSPRDRVCLLASSRPEWCEMDFAILSAGAVTVPIYPTNPASDCGFILWNAEARVIVLDTPDQLAKVRAVQREGITVPEGMELLANNGTPPPHPGEQVHVHVARIVLIQGEGDGGEDLVTMQELLRIGAEAMAERGPQLDRILSELDPEQTATIVYTSGTTGPPKGVVQTHANHLSMCEMIAEEVGVFEEGDVDFLFLPLAHSFARLQEFAGIYCGTVTAFAESMDTIVRDLGEASPQLVPAVPRVYEKIFARVHAQAAGSPLKKRVFDWAVQTGTQISRRKQAGQPIPRSLQLAGRLAHRLVFRKLHALLGGRIKYFISGGAPLSREIAEFFHAAGLLILEGYGLTETCPAISINRPNAFRFGTVGTRLPRVEVKIASDGELLARGPNVTRQYYRRPQATAEAWDADGWFHTGDIAEIQADGYIRITDRKKELIVTAAGKNIAPQNVENTLKSSPYISQVLLYGDSKPYCVAVVTLSEAVAEWAAARGKNGKSLEQLARDPEVRRLIEAEIEQRNQRLARFEAVKNFAIVFPDFTQETGELTPTLKLKRRVIIERHRPVIESLYQTSPSVHA
jgi:long-chain acyl-CoA synthetase